MEKLKAKKAEQAKYKEAAEQAVRNTKTAQQKGLVKDASFNQAQEAILQAKEVGASTEEAERMLKQARAAAEAQHVIDEKEAEKRAAAEAQAAREAAFKAEGKVAPENFFDALRSDSDEDKTMALHQLTDLVDRIEGEDEWELCAELREQGSIVDIGKCVGSDEAHMHQPALLLLATLTTEDVDPQADETKLSMKNGGIFDLIWPHLFSNVALTVAFACAVVQNTISDPDFTAELHDNGSVDRLRELAHCDLPQIVQAAKACLHNMAEAADNAQMSMRMIMAVTRLQRGLRKRVSGSALLPPASRLPPAACPPCFFSSRDATARLVAPVLRATTHPAPLRPPAPLPPAPLPAALVPLPRSARTNSACRRWRGRRARPLSSRRTSARCRPAAPRPSTVGTRPWSKCSARFGGSSR